MRRLALLAGLFALSAAACSSSTTPPLDTGPGSDIVQTDATTGMDSTTGTDTPAVQDVLPELSRIDAPASAFEQQIGPIALPVGREVTMCVLQRLGNATPQYLRRITTHLGSNSHHMIVFRSNVTEERTTPFECRGFSGVTDINMIESPLIIAQQQDAVLTMPDGVGMNLDANQMIRLEFHVINTGRTDTTALGTVHFDTVERTDALTPADVMFWGNTRINIPARTQQSVHFWHRAMSGVRIFGLTSHTHHYGVLSTISLATNATPRDHTAATDIRELHRSTDWSDPPLTLFEPAMPFEAGQGLHLVCNYNNTSDETVTFGESFNQEMCFLWAYYYPAPRGPHICAENAATNGTVCIPLGT